MRFFLIFLILVSSFSSFVSLKPKAKKPQVIEVDKFHLDVLNQNYEQKINLRQRYERELKVDRSKIYKTLEESKKTNFLQKRLYHSALLIYGIDNSMTVRDYNKKFFPKASVIGTAKFRFVSVITRDTLREFANYKLADVLVVRTFFNAKKNLYYYEMELLYLTDLKAPKLSAQKSLNRVQNSLKEYFVYNSKAKVLSNVEVEKNYALATIEEFQEKKQQKKQTVEAKKAQDPKQPFQKNTQQAAQDQKAKAKATAGLSAQQKAELKREQREAQMKKLLFFTHYSGMWLDVETGYLYTFFYTATYSHEIVKSEYKSDFVAYLSKEYLVEQRALEAKAKAEQERKEAEAKAKAEREKKAKAAAKGVKEQKTTATAAADQKNKETDANKDKKNLNSFLGNAIPANQNNAQNTANQNNKNAQPKKEPKVEEYSGLRGFKSSKEMKAGEEKKYYIVTGIMKGKIAGNLKVETFNPAFRVKPKDLLIKFNTLDGKGFFVDNNKNIKEVTVKAEPRRNYIALLLPNGEKRYLIHINANVNPRSVYKLYAEGTQKVPTSERPSHLYEEKGGIFTIKEFYNEYPIAIVGISLLFLVLIA